MRYSKAVYLMNGEKILVTEDDATKIGEALVKNHQGFVRIEGQVINKSSITMIGDHSSTAHLKTLDRGQADVKMETLGMGKLVEKKRKDLMEKSINNALEEQHVMIGKEYEDYLKGIDTKQLENKPQTDEETMRGEPAYYINENGEKMYS
jgi:hypothetical protein